MVDQKVRGPTFNQLVICEREQEQKLISVIVNLHTLLCSYLILSHTLYRCRVIELSSPVLS